MILTCHGYLKSTYNILLKKLNTIVLSVRLFQTKMDASSIVAAASGGSIVVISWVAASMYLFSYDKHYNEVKKDRSYVYSWTFHVESLRFYAFINFIIVLGIGALITEKSGLGTIQDPTETVIFNMFGFNHACNWIDHNSARMIKAILFLPLVAYTVARVVGLTLARIELAVC